MAKAGSSSSDTSGSGGGGVLVCGATIGARAASGLESDSESVAVVISGWVFSTFGGKSVVLCLPVVQGSMVRNSSKVRTRGLQHFQPIIVGQWL